MEMMSINLKVKLKPAKANDHSFQPSHKRNKCLFVAYTREVQNYSQSMDEQELISENCW